MPPDDHTGATTTDWPGRDHYHRHTRWHGWDHMASRLSMIGARLGETMSETFASMPPRASDTVERSVPVEGPVSVRVENFAGWVVVRAGAGDTVTAVAERYAPHHLDLPDITLDVRQDDAKRVEVVCSASGAAWFARHARLTVSVPAGSAVEVSTSGGTVTVERTGAAVRARTAGGSVYLTGCSGDSSAETIGGSIHVTEHDGPVRARTLGGSIRISGHLNGTVEAETQGGSITILVPQISRLKVDGRGTGAVSDFPEVVAHLGRLEGMLGDGADGTLTMRTAGGSVSLRRMA